MLGKAMGLALLAVAAGFSGCMSALDATSYDLLHDAVDDRRVVLAEERFLLSGAEASWTMSVAVPAGVQGLEVVLVLEDGDSFDLQVAGLGECSAVLRGASTAGGAPIRDACPAVEKGVHALQVSHGRGEASGRVFVFAML